MLPVKDDVPVETWDVPDPYGRSEKTFQQTRDQIEMLVMNLILRIRTGKFDSGTAMTRE
ncbi:MAG: hypothetical protein H7Y20_17660 [Bryobacteraceae bacterium]|nr:hypothetical protein [Bryobacteraceae bacterium]